MTNGNDFINPSTHQNADGTHDFSINKGLTKREYFAAMAMQGLIYKDFYTPKELAKRSVSAADTLINELNETN